MGGKAWDEDVFITQKKYRKTMGIADFDYDAVIRNKPINEWQCHPDLDPRLIKGVRESRDSDASPESVALANIFDVTGSMGEIPVIFQDKLGKLMTMIIAKGALSYPHVLTGAVGDATCDHVPFQVSQFETDNLVDEQLRKIFVERGGGGQISESYGLAFYFAGWKTAIDCFEKRGKKGYLFVTGDEMPWPITTREQINAIFGDHAEADITIEEAIAKAQEKYEVFFIIATTGSNGRNPRVHNIWHKLLGERVLLLDDPALVCELIVSAISLIEGIADSDTMTDDLGLDAAGKKIVSTALAPYVKKGVPARTAVVSGSLPAPADPSRGKTKRL